MTQTANALFLYRNQADDAVATASSEITNAEAALTQFMDPGQPWRAEDKVLETLTYDHGSEITATHGFVVAHNLDTFGTIQQLLSNSPTFAGTPVLDTGELEAWEPVAGYGFDGYGTSYGGYPLLSKFNDYRPLKVIDFGGPKSFRYSRFVFRNPDNAGITGIAAGRAGICLGFQPEYNFAYDWENEWVDPSTVTETNATVRVKRRRTYRKLRLSLPSLKTGEAIGAWDDIKRTIGTSRDMVIVLFPTGASPVRLRTSIYCIPVERAGTRNPHLDVFASTMTVRELAA